MSSRAVMAPARPLRSEVRADIGGVTTAVMATGTAASDVLENARALDKQSGMLRSVVDEFLAKVRAA